jgi:hypothetical protein
MDLHVVLQVAHLVLGSVDQGLSNPLAMRKRVSRTVASVSYNRSDKIRILLGVPRESHLRVLGVLSRDAIAAAEVKIEVWYRDIATGFDHTENVEVGELHAFKAGPVVSVDGTVEDGTESFVARVDFFFLFLFLFPATSRAPVDIFLFFPATSGAPAAIFLFFSGRAPAGIPHDTVQ